MERAFKIRGHHLSSFTEKVSDVRANAYTLSAERDALADKGSLLTSEQQELDYRNDVLGETPADLFEFTKRSVDLLKEFRNLPDDHPVEIIAAKDEMCQTCPIVGDHCQVSANTFGPEGETRLRRDKKGIERFGTEAVRLGFGDNLERFTSRTDYKDRENVDVESIRTHASVAKEVFEKSNILRRSIN